MEEKRSDETNNCQKECNNTHENCNHHNCCKRRCHNQIVCPVCHHLAVEVPLETVRSMTNINELTGKFYLCSGRECNVAYFNEEYLIEKSELNTKIWFKESLDEFIVCYCHNIKLKDIVHAVKQTKTTNKEEILKFLGKKFEDNDCLHKNPAGTSCDKLFENALEYANELNN